MSSSAAVPGGDQQQSRPFDIVIVAAPQTEDQPGRLQWRGLPDSLRFPGSYHNLSVTLVNARVGRGGADCAAVSRPKMVRGNIWV